MANVGSVNGSLVQTNLTSGIVFASASGVLNSTASGATPLPVAQGGTGAASYNVDGPVISNTTTTGALSSVTLNNQKFLVGNTSAAPTAKALSVVTQVFTSTGTYTPTAGMVYCIIQCLGGGGAGGGSAATNASQYSGGAGGGAGEYAVGTFSAATIGASQSVTIGAAGTANSGAAGGNGGNTSVGSTLISANGGTGGATGAAASFFTCTGGAGGTGGTGGDYRTPGMPGFSAGGVVSGSFITAGAGASSQIGSGGVGAFIASTQAGSAGLGYGAGGSGAVGNVNGAAQLGGVGTKGVVIVTEYVIA